MVQSSLTIFYVKNVFLKNQTSYKSNYLDAKNIFLDLLDCTARKYILFAIRIVTFLFQMDNWIMIYRDEKFRNKVDV